MDDTRQLVQNVQSMQGEKNSPSEGDVEPTITSRKDPTGQNPLVTLEMAEEEVEAWWKRIDAAETRRKAREEGWDVLLENYMPPKPKKSGQEEDLKIARQFRDVHTRIGNLFYRSPELILMPKDPGPATNQMPNPMQAMTGVPMPPLTMEDIIAVKKAVLDQKLGPDEIDAMALMDELLFDCLAWSGIGCSKLGYRCTLVQTQEPIMEPDPTALVTPPQPAQNLASPLGISGAAQQTQKPPMRQKLDPLTQQPMMQTVPIPIYEEWYWRRFSPKKMLWNDDLRSTRFDQDGTWMGKWFFMDPQKAMLPPAQGGFGLTDGEIQAATEDDRVHKYDDDASTTKSPSSLVCGVELFCKASVFGDNPHPLAMNQLILIKGLRDRPVVWRPSPDQEFDAQGKLTDDSLIGFPFRVLTLRDCADSPFPPSDSAFTASETKELQTWRRQSISLRNAAIGKYLYDKGAFGETETDLLKNGEIGQYIGVEDGRLKDGPDKILTIAAQIHGTQDDYRNQELIRRDLDETLGIGANQSGAPEQTVRTATETATVNAAVNARNDKELARVVKFYLQGVRMIDQLLMRYADQNQYVHIVGENGARRMQIWNNQMISGKFLYDISPDSQLRQDNARDWQLALNFYNVAAPDPLFNRPYMLRQLARMRGLDPDKVVLKPEQIMQQPPHGGTSSPGDVVNKHQQSNSGNRPNAPMQENHRETSPV